MLHLLQMIRFKVLNTLLLYIQNSWQLSLLELPPSCVPASSGDPTPTNTVTSSSDSSGLYTCTVQSGPSANAALPPYPRPHTFYPPATHFVNLPLHSHHRLMLLVVPLHFLLPLSPLTPSGFFNVMLGVSEPGALNFYTLFCLIPLTLSVSRNLTLTHLSFSGSLDSLLCNLIPPTPGLVFFLQMRHTLAAASSFSSGRAYSSLSFLPPLFLHLTPTLIM